MPHVRLRGPLKQLAGDRSDHEVEGGCVGDLLVALEREHPEIDGWILDESGELRRHLNVFVNGEQGTKDTPVEGEDRIDVIPAISGGARP
jgi:sulfur-carrier protein